MPKLITKWSELQAKLSPAARAESDRLLKDHLKKMPLHELRAARRLTQQQLAQTLDMSQAAVSQTGEAHGYVPEHARKLCGSHGWPAGNVRCVP